MTRSIQQLPNNSGSTSTKAVYTATGFNAGDPVYFQNGDYKSPANLTAPSTVNFNFVDTPAINPNGTGGIIAPSFTYAQMQTGISGGTNRRFAAVLTNGNIVQAWINYTVAPVNANCPYFRVITPSGTVVVSPTAISTTYLATSYVSLSVVALTGGGFAVGWLNNVGGTGNSANYAVYSSTGTVVTAATQDTSFASGANYVPLEMTSLANGGFAIAVKNSGALISLRAYSSTGVGAYATISTGITAAGNENSFALTARSDSSVFVCDRIATSGSAYQYALFNTSGTAIVAATSFTISSGSLGTPAQGIGGPDASVQTDGTTIVVAFYDGDGTNSYPAFKFLPTGNTLSATTIAIPSANLFYQGTLAGGYLSVQCLSSNNFIIYFSDGYGNMQYAFYNSSGTCVSGSNGTGAVPLQVTGGFCAGKNRITLLESSGSVYAYWTAATNLQKPVQQVYCKINTSTYLVTPISTTTGSTYVVPAQPTGAYVLSTVNPNSLSFYSTASSTTVSTNTPATVSGPVVVSTGTCDAIASCTLPNGNFVVAWRVSGSTPYPISAAVYSPAGALLTTVAVGTSTDTIVFTVKVAALSGGGFVVSYTSTNTVLTLQVYSAGYAPTVSTSLTIYSYGTTYNHDTAGLQDNNFVVFYSLDGTNARIRVYNSALTALQSFDNSQTPQGLAVAGNPWGGFSVAYYRQSNSAYFFSYVPTAANTWAQSSTAGMAGLGSYNQNPQLCATQSGLYIFTGYSSGYAGYGMFTDSGVAVVSYTGALTSWPLGSNNNPNSYPFMGIGMTGNGNVVIATAYSSTNLGIACLPSQMTYSTGQPLPYSITGSSSPTMFSKNGYTATVAYDASSQPRVTPGVGNNAVITFKGASQYASFIIVNGTSLSNVYAITAGVTPSALTPVAPVATSGVILGVFAGVAITGAAAGSTGQLAINGQALLGTSYTTTATGAFDGTGGALVGLKGTFNGRSVNLQGNS